MIEEFCRPSIYHKCEHYNPFPLVSLKCEKRPEQKYPDFFKGMDSFTIYDKGFAKKLVHEPSRSPLRLAVGLFSRNGALIAQPFINDWYDGSWEVAMTKSKTFDRLFDDFKAFFNYRRKLFMEKTDKLIDTGIENGQIKFHKSRVPSSHGGVANLLKVLTKTMYEQGSSIRTIAKVQYTVCLQSGIYIPDEFITDVLVAADIKPDLFIEDEKNEKV